MTAVVKHVYTQPGYADVNGHNLVVADTPVAGDVMVLLVSHNTTNSTPNSVAGMGATWSRISGFPGVNGTLDAWIGVGATTSGTVTASGPTATRALVGFMLAGVNPTAVGVPVSGAGAQTSTAQTAGNGQAVLGFSFTDNAANAITTLVPASGWTETDVLIAASRYMGVAYRTPSTSEIHTTSAQRSSGTTYVAQIVVGTGPPLPPRTNMLSNPSFETGVAGWDGDGGTIPTQTAVAAAAKAGTQAAYVGSLLIAKTGKYPATAGLPYTGSAWATKTTTAGRSAAVSVRFYDAGGAELDAPTVTGIDLVTLNVPERRYNTRTAPAGTTQVAFWFHNTSLTGASTTLFDAALLEQTDTLQDYFDGDTTDTAVGTYTWTGTPHASSSKLNAVAGNNISSTFAGSGVLTTAWSHYRNLDAALSGSGALASQLSNYKRIASGFSGSGSLSTLWTNYRDIASSFAGAGILTTDLVAGSEPVLIDSAFSGAGSLATALTNYRRISSGFSGAGTLSTELDTPTPPAPLVTIETALSGEGVLFTELGFTVVPPALGTSHLGKLASFAVSTSAVPVNPAEGSGSAPSVNASYTKGTDPEYALGETNVLKNGAIGTYEGEVVKVGTSPSSGVARISMGTVLTPLNVDLHLFPFIDGVPGLWTAARAIDYWTQQAGVFYDKVPGDCIAYASGFGHVDAFGASTTARFYERLTGGTTATQVVNGRSVKTLGSAVTGKTSFHEDKDGSVAVSVPKNRKLVFSAGLGLLGAGRTATVEWSFLDSKDVRHTVSLAATSGGSVTASIGSDVVASTSVPAGATYRLAFSLERLSATALLGKLTVHTDDLAGSGELAYDGASAVISKALPSILRLTHFEHRSAGGSGAQMTRWGTYLTVAGSHPMELPAVQKVLGQSKKPFGFVSGFTGNVWNLLNEFCAIARLEVRFIDGALQLAPRSNAVANPGISWSRFESDRSRREKYKQVAVVNKQSVAVDTDDAVLWRADSVFQVAAREVFETTVQTGHSILNVVQPVPVSGIMPFPYIKGAGQYVVTGADGYIIAPEWWNDNGGKVEVSLTGEEGEIAIKITAPTLDTVRAPYRISEGEADRPALYVCGSGILNDPKEVHVSTGAKNAREGFDSVFESPFIAGVRETYDTAVAMAQQYSASVADVQYELPNTFETPTGLGQFPAGALVTDNLRNYRIQDASQTNSKVSGNAVPHTTIGAYVASYPAGATIRDEKARSGGRSIRKFNIKPLKGDA